MKPTAKLKSLCVILDSHHTDHVSAVGKATWNYHILALRQIRHLLTPDVVNTPTCGIVGTRLDHCTSPLYGAHANVNGDEISTVAELHGSSAAAAAQKNTRRATLPFSLLAAHQASHYLLDSCL